MRDPQVWGEAASGLPSSGWHWHGTASSATGPDFLLRQSGGWSKPSLSDTPLFQIL